MLKKLPEFNVVYSVDMVNQVNKMSVRSYDPKMDDRYLNVDGNCLEPQPICLDIHDQNKLKTNLLPKPTNIMIDSQLNTSSIAPSVKSGVGTDKRLNENTRHSLQNTRNSNWNEQTGATTSKDKIKGQTSPT